MNKTIKECYNTVLKEVKTNPRKCEKCGTIETIDNLMLKYNIPKECKVMTLCDECLFDIVD